MKLEQIIKTHVQNIWTSLKSGESLESVLKNVICNDGELDVNSCNILHKFIDFIIAYEGLIKSNQLIETQMVAGMYEATTTVTAINWARLKNAINAISKPTE